MTDAQLVLGPRELAGHSHVAILLHWLIAAIIVVQLFLGWRMSDATPDLQRTLLDFHTSIGITILLLSLLRLGVRLFAKRPEPAQGLSDFELRASKWAHITLYVAMIGLPLSGWLMMSTSRGHAPIMIFGSIPWPRIWGVDYLPSAIRNFFGDFGEFSHVALVWVTVATLALHVGGALKHQFLSQNTVMGRMLPGLSPGAWRDRRLIAIPIAALALAALAYVPQGRALIQRPKVTDLAQADIFLDVVQPSLMQRCSSCHGNLRSKGDFSVESYDAIMEGGEEGVAIIGGDTSKSDLYRRITLPKNHEDFMPSDNKTPLTKSQVAAIGWWISIGAPADGLLADLAPPRDIADSIARVVGLKGGDGFDGDGDQNAIVLATVDPADAKSVSKLEELGYVVRPVMQGSNLLDVNRFAITPISGEEIALLKAIAVQLSSLSVGASGLTDAQLAQIGPMPNVRSLRLEQTAVGDSGIAALASAKSLAYLNVYGTKVSDAGLQSLAKLGTLQRVHAWNTQATEAGAARLKAARPDLDVEVELQVAQPTGQVSRQSPTGALSE